MKVSLTTTRELNGWVQPLEGTEGLPGTSLALCGHCVGHVMHVGNQMPQAGRGSAAKRRLTREPQRGPWHIRRPKAGHAVEWRHRLNCDYCFSCKSDPSSPFAQATHMSNQHDVQFPTSSEPWNSALLFFFAIRDFALSAVQLLQPASLCKERGWGCAEIFGTFCPALRTTHHILSSMHYVRCDALTTPWSEPRGLLPARAQPQRGGGGGGGGRPLYRPQNGCMEQWVLWAPEILF